tara:strand:+ start:590 stop:766 length:177 start_codon:yes stop_codon:yes gene_type:complete
LTYLITKIYTDKDSSKTYQIGKKIKPSDAREKILMEHLMFIGRAIRIQELDLRIETKG